MTHPWMLFLLMLSIIAALVYIIMRSGKKKALFIPLPADMPALLLEHVAFYRRLDEAGKQQFESRVRHFIETTRITGVHTTVEALDQVLIGASAIIPIFAFPEWEYINLREVLLYPDSFSEEFETIGKDRSISGMVGDGPMQQIMILSRDALRSGFSNDTDKHNTAIHEFVHLIDKTDGAVDGVPEVLLQHQYTLPWIKLIHGYIKTIRSGRSDINPYGATSEAEFLAVISEYFFERPDLLKNKHPELYEMLEKMFKH